MTAVGAAQASPPRLHFAAPVYSRGDMAHGAASRGFAHKSSAGVRRVHATCYGFLKTHEVGSVFAVLQLCQCATDALCDWLKLMEGAELSLDYTQAHTPDTGTEFTSLSTLLFWV